MIPTKICLRISSLSKLFLDDWPPENNPSGNLVITKVNRQLTDKKGLVTVDVNKFTAIDLNKRDHQTKKTVRKPTFWLLALTSVKFKTLVTHHRWFDLHFDRWIQERKRILLINYQQIPQFHHSSRKEKSLKGQVRRRTIASSIEGAIQLTSERHFLLLLKDLSCLVGEDKVINSAELLA